MKLYQWNPEADGPCSEAALINKLEKMGYQCTCYTYPKGTIFPEHSHNLDKIDAVLKGQLKITMAGTSLVLHAGDYVFIAHGTRHSAEVVGDEAVVSIDAVRPP